jgi:UDP-N-acetyl-D-mannosaminuronic acid dehydrogenase
MRTPLKGKTAGILGMDFKANNDDKRQSLSYKLKKLLEIEAAEVLCTDAYIDDPAFVSPEELVRRSDVIVVGTPHRQYASLAIPAGKVVVDVWDFLKAGAS